MLRTLQLRDYVIVGAAEIEFGPGFNVLSGETGAGKSILVDALLLALGARADSGAVREPAARAEITAGFDSVGAVEIWIAARDLGGDPGTVLVRRVIEADGRSRAYINGHASTVAQLRELGELLLAVHGQHAHQALVRAEAQRTLLDAFAGCGAQAAEVAAAFRDWRDAASRLAQASEREREFALERERLEWQIGELSAAGLAPGEWQTLSDEQRRLAHAQSLIEAANGAVEALLEADEAQVTRLYQIGTQLKSLLRIDRALAPAVELLESATIHVEEAARLLSEYARGIDLDPERIEDIDRRLALAHGVARKFRIAPEDIPRELESVQARLAALARARDLAALERGERDAAARFGQAADALSSVRRRAAPELAAAVTRSLHALGMPRAEFAIDLASVEASAAGIDRVEFLVAPHAGTAPRPIARIASGGELSRIGLAIAANAAAANPVPTLVFDEADAGVGGAVAERVGQLMRTLGSSTQVLAVTHLPQVAAQAHRHFSVEKVTHDGRTTALVRPLTDAQRIEEVARMLGGVQITATTRRHARELLSAD
ncbi:MAG: DNA repair protein RecN [Burkholderiales bacterium]|nr:MAG: DNA repair protein RecN [Burkholderiales bacterium]